MSSVITDVVFLAVTFGLGYWSGFRVATGKAALVTSAFNLVASKAKSLISDAKNLLK